MLTKSAGLRLWPHTLSFTSAYNIVRIGIPDLLAAPTEIQQIERMERIIGLVGRCKLPNRHKRRSFPRAVRDRGANYPRCGKTK